MNAEHGVHLVPEGQGGLTVASERLSAITGAVPRRPATSFAPALGTTPWLAFGAPGAAGRGL
jgi:hypothetical protein